MLKKIVILAQLLILMMYICCSASMSLPDKSQALTFHLPYHLQPNIYQSGLNCLNIQDPLIQYILHDLNTNSASELLSAHQNITKFEETYLLNSLPICIMNQLPSSSSDSSLRFEFKEHFTALNSLSGAMISSNYLLQTSLRLSSGKSETANMMAIAYNKSTDHSKVSYLKTKLDIPNELLKYSGCIIEKMEEGNAISIEGLYLKFITLFLFALICGFFIGKHFSKPKSSDPLHFILESLKNLQEHVQNPNAPKICKKDEIGICQPNPYNSEFNFSLLKSVIGLIPTDFTLQILQPAFSNHLNTCDLNNSLASRRKSTADTDSLSSREEISPELNHNLHTPNISVTAEILDSSSISTQFSPSEDTFSLYNRIQTLPINLEAMKSIHNLDSDLPKSKLESEYLSNTPYSHDETEYNIYKNRSITDSFGTSRSDEYNLQVENEDKLINFQGKTNSFVGQGWENELPNSLRRRYSSYKRVSVKINGDNSASLNSLSFINEINQLSSILEDGRCQRSYEIQSKLGRGEFGTVYKARHILDEQIYAIKMIPFTVGINRNVKEHKLFREVTSMSKLNSKYLLRYYNCWLESHSGISSPTSDDISSGEESSMTHQSMDSSIELGEPYFSLKLHIQTEYSPGVTLQNWLERPGRGINRQENLFIFRQLAKGVLHIHQHGFIHRDLKPANIFIENDLKVKIGDFGLAILHSSDGGSEQPEPIDKAQSGSNHSMNVGTPLYLAPEQKKTSAYGPKVDVYSLGFILLELSMKFYTGHEKLMIFRELRKNSKLPECVERDFPIESALIKLLTQADPQNRPDSLKVLQNPLLTLWEESVSKDAEIYSGFIESRISYFNLVSHINTT